MKIDYKIMGIPSRKDNIEALKRAIGITDTDVFIDTECRKSPMWTWKKTAQLVSKNATHLVIVQDDAILCDRFTEFCEYLVRRFPNDILMLCNKYDVSHVLPKGVVFQPGYCVGGQATILPTSYIGRIVECQERNFPEHTEDDNMICYWAHHNNVRVLATHPSVVTTFEGGSEISHKGNTAALFEPNPIGKKWANATSKPLFNNRSWESPSSPFVR